MFPATRSNQITYLYFCTLGGLSNPGVTAVQRHNGTYNYVTYHLISVL